MSAVPTRCHEQCANILAFRSKIVFFDISRIKRDVSVVQTRCPKQCASFFVFWSNKFFFDILISGGRTREREMQRFQRGTLNSERVFSLFGPKFFTSISRTGKSDVSVVQTRCPEQYASIFVFWSNKFFFDISISEGRTGEREV